MAQIADFKGWNVAYTFVVQPSAGLSTPTNSAFSTSTTGGSLANGTYYYRVSAYNAVGESLASTETSQVTTGTNISTVTVNWGAVSGAVGYKVYGRTTGAELLLATLGNVTTFIDTGAITPAGALPTFNSSGARISADSNNSKTINYAWVVPLATGALVGIAIGGAQLSVTFAAKDLNIAFPIPFTQITSFAGGAGNLLAVFPAY